MNKYFDIVAGAIGQLEDPTGVERAEVYARIRSLLAERLDNSQASLTSRQKVAERLKFEDAIRSCEREYRSAAENAPPRTSSQTLSFEDFENAANVRPALSSALSSRMRILQTLIVRTMRLAASRDRTTSFLMFAEPCLQIAMIVFVYWLVGRLAVLDMPALPFAAIGATCWYMFRNVAIKVSEGADNERILLSFAPVSRFDIALSRAVFVGFTYLLIMLCILIALYALAYADTPENPLLMAFWFFIIWFSGLNLGLAVQPYTSRTPWIKRVFLMATRILYLASGVMFVSEQLFPEFRIWLLWNPILHMNQLVKSAFFVQYESQDALPAFALAFTVTLALLGLAGERASLYRKVRV